MPRTRPFIRRSHFFFLPPSRIRIVDLIERLQAKRAGDKNLNLRCDANMFLFESAGRQKPERGRRSFDWRLSNARVDVVLSQWRRFAYWQLFRLSDAQFSTLISDSHSPKKTKTINYCCSHPQSKHCTYTNATPTDSMLQRIQMTLISRTKWKMSF